MNPQNNSCQALLTRRSWRAIPLLAMALACAPALAETVAVPLGQQSQAANVDKPRSGVTKEAVTSRFGEPLQQAGPVGEPPIYTWDYDKFTVYFEGDRVIHAVVKHQAQAAR